MILFEIELFLFSVFERGNDFGFCCFCVILIVDFNLFVFFQIFVVFKEMSDLGFQQFWQVVYIVDVIVFFVQFGVWYGNQFCIFIRFVGYFQNVNWMVVDYGVWLQWVWSWDQYVNWVVVQGQGVVDVVVVVWIEYCCGYEMVNEQCIVFFVDFVFDRICVCWDFDYDVDVFWQIFVCRYVE